MNELWKKVRWVLVGCVMVVGSLVWAGSDVDNTKNLDLSVSVQVDEQVIVGQDFTMSIMIYNANTSEGDAYKP
jgi:hypothetical protein